jgi:hypothetical protein
MPSVQGRSYEVTEWHHRCAVCGYQWVSLKQHPVHCPDSVCRSRLWYDGEYKNEKLKQRGAKPGRRNGNQPFKD